MITKLSERHAPLAQLDRASGYGPEGRGFESLTAYQKCQTEGLGTFVFTFLKKISVGRIPSAAHADSFLRIYVL